MPATHSNGGMPNEESDSVLLRHEPCPACGSRDNLARYSDGHGYCFGCHHYEPSTGDGGERDNQQYMLDLTTPRPEGFIEGEFEPLPKRGLTLETCRFFGVRTGHTRKGQRCVIYPYFNGRGQPVSQKLRTSENKGLWVNYKKDLMLFGQHLWGQGRKIVITEGEFDAMAVAQVQGLKWPTVSIPGGASNAKRDLAANLQWLEENFEEIILMFDMDEPGQKAALESAPLFTPGKVKIARLSMKDANELLLAGKGDEIVKAIWNAKPYHPDGIVTVDELIPALDAKPEYGATLPWESLYKYTHGLRPGQLWVWTSGSGMGKTEFFKEIAAHLIAKEKAKVGLVFLEEEGKDTLIHVAGKIAGVRFDDPDAECDLALRDKTVRQLANDNQLFLYNENGNDTTFDSIKSVIRHMVAGLGCTTILLDHITAFTDGAGTEANALAERMMKELAAMVRNLKFNLQVISHIRKSESSRKPAEEGGRVKIDDMKGSGAVKQWANFVIALERNQQASGDKAHITTVRILKARGVGKNVGRTFNVRYDPALGVLRETDESFGELDDEDTCF